ncbi:hypothetical protein [Phenylobacterium montanum]|uniref:Uncharacterized protein n=1 Tax=Phenylobacterium montanum TaxID=2823693 RepID=A0A975IW21_9CAUL|nr:hypothetical protein [Caulobacter sp. S6]QUD89627.1 hypothetical protein KCG34_07065 [Caulobacter sp. S6]
MSAPLKVVTPEAWADAAPVAAPANLGERIRLLQAEARGLAREQIEALKARLAETSRMAEDIAAGGEAYPVGVRELAARLGQDSAAKALALEALMNRC